MSYEKLWNMRRERDAKASQMAQRFLREAREEKVDVPDLIRWMVHNHVVHQEVMVEDEVARSAYDDGYDNGYDRGYSDGRW